MEKVIVVFWHGFIKANKCWHSWISLSVSTSVLSSIYKEHLETSKAWMPNSKDMPAVDTGGERGDGKPVQAHPQHRYSSTGAETPSLLVTHHRGDCSGYIKWPDLAHHHHLATLAVAGTCLCYLNNPCIPFPSGYCSWRAFSLSLPGRCPLQGNRFKRASAGRWAAGE